MQITFIIGVDPGLLARFDRALHLLAEISAKESKMVDTIDKFVADMTTKMNTVTTEIAALKIFIADLFAKIGAVPGLTPAQMTALDAIEAQVDTQATAILEAQKANVPAAANPAGASR